MKNNLITFILIFILFIGCNKKDIESKKITQTKDLNNKNLKIGDKYNICFNCNDPDPFKKIESYTVEIIDLKSGYVQYGYKFGIKQSLDTTLFKKLIEK